MNHPVKKFKIKDIVSIQDNHHELEQLEKNLKIRSLPARIDMEKLPHSSSKLGVFCFLKHSLTISSKGELLGMHINDKKNIHNCSNKT